MTDKTVLQKLEDICAEIYERWDKDQRAGKLLGALAGTTPGYRKDVDEVRAALASLESPNPADADSMVRIEKLIADLQSIQARFGNTCVYIRRGGLSWGAVALNYRDDDAKNGVFDLQASHDREMQACLERIDRLIAERNEWRARACVVPAPTSPEAAE